MTRAEQSQSEADPNDVEGRRRAPRVESDFPLRIVIEAQAFDGRVDNLSESGVFLFSSGKVRVQVIVNDGTRSQTYGGKLVRVQQMDSEKTGFAIEFDQGGLAPF